VKTRLTAFLLSSLIGPSLLVAACGPEIPGATELELYKACQELRLVRYDYYSLKSIRPSNRILQVAAAIYVNHPSSNAIYEFCRGR